MRSNDWSCARFMHSTTCSRSGCSPRRQPMTSASGRGTFWSCVGEEKNTFNCLELTDGLINEEHESTAGFKT